ncbi:MAG: DUF1015 domain-containing protein, partial [Clostridia bacterium]|nr:DUF1015 domain-containing protein [Clostridia bacterium]
MAEVQGLTGLRPVGESIRRITYLPYDVIKSGSQLELFLQQNEDSLYHLTLGQEPVKALKRLKQKGLLQEEETPCFYVYEQVYGKGIRRGVLAAVAVVDYQEGQIIRHEKTFDDKVKGRLELREKTGYTFEPVFLLTQAPLWVVFDEIIKKYQAEADFVSDFKQASELHGIKNRIFRVEEQSREGQLLKKVLAAGPLYIADGHHRYHASLCNQQTHCLAYVCEATDAHILAYNRVINGLVKFTQIKEKLPLLRVEEFKTPAKHCFAIYTKEGTYRLKASKIPDDVVGRLDCSILEQELYPYLGLTHEMITDSRYFDYYAEDELEKMKECVDAGQYDLAVA